MESYTQLLHNSTKTTGKQGGVKVDAMQIKKTMLPAFILAAALPGGANEIFFLLIKLIVIFMVCYAIWYVTGLIPPPFQWVRWIIILLLAVVVLWYLFGVLFAVM